MNPTRLFLADANEISANGFPKSDSLARRFERSPAGWCLFIWICLTFILPPVIFYYDWLNGHHAFSLYIAHFWPFLMTPIIELKDLLLWIWGG